MDYDKAFIEDLIAKYQQKTRIKIDFSVDENDSADEALLQSMGSNEQYEGVVLLYISTKKDLIEICCDEKNSSKIDDQLKKDVIKNMKNYIQDKKLREALDYGVQTFGEFLALEFPSEDAEIIID